MMDTLTGRDVIRVPLYGTGFFLFLSYSIVYNLKDLMSVQERQFKTVSTLSVLILAGIKFGGFGGFW